MLVKGATGRWCVRTWQLAHQSHSSFWFSRGYSPEPVETSSCTFHCMWVLMFLPSACDVKGIRRLHQGHTHVQPLPNCLCHILKHSWVMCNQCQNRSHPFVGSTPFTPADPVCRPTSYGAGELPSSTVNWFRCHTRWRIHKSQPVILTA